LGGGTGAGKLLNDEGNSVIDIGGVTALYIK